MCVYLNVCLLIFAPSKTTDGAHHARTHAHTYAFTRIPGVAEKRLKETFTQISAPSDDVPGDVMMHVFSLSLSSETVLQTVVSLV